MANLKMGEKWDIRIEEIRCKFEGLQYYGPLWICGYSWSSIRHWL